MSDALDELIAATPAAAGPDELDALITKTAAKAEPGRVESLLRGIKQGGTFSFGNEAVGLLGAPLLRLALGQMAKGGVRLTPQAEAEAKQQGIELAPEQAVPTTGELYTTLRDADTAADKAADEAHGGYYLGGNILGGVATGKVLPLSPFGSSAKGAPLLAKVARGAANALPAGLLYGLGSTEANLLNPYAPTLPTAENMSRAVGDVGTAGGIAMALGGGIPIVGQALSKSPGALKSGGLAMARRVLTGGKTPKTDLPDEAVEQALKNRVVEWFGTTKGAAKRSEALTDKLDDAYQGVAKEMEAKGFQGPEGSEFADPLLRRGQELASETWGSTVPEKFTKAAEEAVAKAGETGRYTLGRTLKLIRNLQKQAKWSPALDNPTNEANKAIAGIAREVADANIERQVAKTADPALKELGAKFMPAKQALRLSLKAQDALEKAAKANPHPLSIPNLLLAAMASGHGAMGHGLTGLAMGLPVAVGSHLARTRGPSTLARGLWNMGRAGEWLPQQSIVQALRKPLSALAQPRGAYGLLAEELTPPAPMPALATDEEEQKRLQMLALAQAVGGH